MLESIVPTLDKYDKERPIPNVVDLSKYKFHYINVLTLLRNIANSFKDPDKVSIFTNRDFVNIVIDEFYMLEGFYRDTPLVIYHCDYTKVSQALNKDKVNNADKYIQFDLANTIITKLVKQVDAIKEKVKMLDHRLPKINEKFLLTTSSGVDLLNSGNYDLLESHTGVLKLKHQFNTKYHKVGKYDLSSLPFVESLLYILGDNTMVKPYPFVVRREVMDISISKNWTTETTSSKINANIRESPNLKFVFNNYNKMYN